MWFTYQDLRAEKCFVNLILEHHETSGRFWEFG
jgi:hypothetical protein